MPKILIETTAVIPIETTILSVELYTNQNTPLIAPPAMPPTIQFFALSLVHVSLRYVTGVEG